jgi:hypothetical protein
MTVPKGYQAMPVLGKVKDKAETKAVKSRARL